jgi:pyruvate-formate lyase
MIGHCHGGGRQRQSKNDFRNFHVGEQTNGPSPNSQTLESPRRPSRYADQSFELTEFIHGTRRRAARLTTCMTPKYENRFSIDGCATSTTLFPQ